MAFESPEKLAESLRKGEMVVLLDDEDRENEGDLVASAGLITPEAINFMATHGRGLICLAITASRAEQLRLPMMTNHNESSHTTNFTVSIEAREGVSTGISAHDRAHTILTAIKADAQPEDLVMPGHIFPIVAQKGGVLVRAGHTEAGCDLVAMAGLEPSAVIVEILNPDGSMARRDQLIAFAEKHKLLIGTIESLIEHRLATEFTVEKVYNSVAKLPQGEFALHGYRDSITGFTHIALVRGDISQGSPLVRVHQYAGISDLLNMSGKGSWGLQDALTKVAEEDHGLVVLLHSQSNSEDNLERLMADKHEPSKLRSINYVSHGTGAQILRDLGVGKMRLLSSTMHFSSLAAFGLEIVEFITQ